MDHLEHVQSRTQTIVNGVLTIKRLLNNVISLVCKTNNLLVVAGFERTVQYIYAVHAKREPENEKDKLCIWTETISKNLQALTCKHKEIDEYITKIETTFVFS